MIIEDFKVLKGPRIEPKDFGKLQYPLLASTKLDGIRCHCHVSGLKSSVEVLSASNKPIPNKYITIALYKELRRVCEENEVDEAIFDGEIIIGNFQETSSGVMSREGEPKFIYYIFDVISESIDKPFSKRTAELEDINFKSEHIRILRQWVVSSEEELNKLLEKAVEEGEEGLIVRSLDGVYKYKKRATAKDAIVFKVKPFDDAEAEVLDFEEMIAGNGDLKNTLGKFKVRDIKTGVEFSVGGGKGLTKELRQQIWGNKKQYSGKIIKYQYQSVGTKDKPRLPQFLGFRDEIDITEY